MKNSILMAAIIAHHLLVGADAFCQVAICPVVLSAPQSSLAMNQGEVTYNSSLFWRPVNMIALGLLIMALIMNWPTSRRNLMLTWTSDAQNLGTGDNQFSLPNRPNDLIGAR